MHAGKAHTDACRGRSIVSRGGGSYRCKAHADAYKQGKTHTDACRQVLANIRMYYIML